MSEAHLERVAPTGDFFVDDGYDLSMFDDAPTVGPYSSFTEAEAFDSSTTMVRRRSSFTRSGTAGAGFQTPWRSSIRPRMADSNSSDRRATDPTRGAPKC